MCPVTLSAIGLGGVASALGIGGTAAAAGTAAAVTTGAVAGTAVAGASAAALTTTQIVSLGLTLASGAFGLVQSISQAGAQKKALKQQARREEEAATDALRRGEKESNRARLIGARERSEQAARMAANGLSITSGDALDVLDEAALLTEQDAFRIRTDANREAQGNLQRSASLRTEASSVKRSAVFQGIGTVLTTGSRVASQWRSFTAAPVS